MKQFGVIGLGTFGLSVAVELIKNGAQVLAVDTDEQKVQEASSLVTQAVVADSTDESALKEIGIADFDCVIVAIGNNIEASILTTLILKEIGVKNIVVKGIDDLHAKVLQKLGADRIIFPEKEMGEKVAQSLVAPNILEKIEISPEYDMAEIVVPKAFIDKTISELDIRVKYKLHIIGIKRKMPYITDAGDTDFKEDLIIAPSATEVLQDGDVFVTIGKYADIERVKNI